MYVKTDFPMIKIATRLVRDFNTFKRASQVFGLEGGGGRLNRSAQSKFSEKQ